MEFEWDEAKDAANRAKHGLGLGEAARMDWARTVPAVDARADYGEARLIAYAPIDGRLHVCVYTLRGRKRRIISLRKANKREERAHGIR
jgi:uncharacterized DUF497 family protein